jgi:hypothetical protein
MAAHRGELLERPGRVIVLNVRGAVPLYSTATATVVVALVEPLVPVTVMI